jgi:hypothetical protein
MVAVVQNYIAGQVSVTVDGQAYLLVGEFAYRISGFSVETLEGQDGVHGAKGKIKAGMIKMKLRDNGAVPLAALSGKSAASVVAELANGKVVSGANMWRVGEPIEVESEDATFEITFEGGDVSDG